MKTSDNQIHASTARKVDGWAAVLEFPNGGRQVFSQRFWSHESALRDAEKCLKMRLTYPDGVIPDPQPHTLMEVGDQSDKGMRLETYMAVTHPNCI